MGKRRAVLRHHHLLRMTHSETKCESWEEELRDGLLSGKFAGKTGVKWHPLTDFIRTTLHKERERMIALGDGLKRVEIHDLDIRHNAAITAYQERIRQEL